MEIAAAQAMTGDPSGAMNTAAFLTDPRAQEEFWRVLAISQARAGDTRGALIDPDTDERALALRAVARVQARAGDAGAALRTVGEIRGDGIARDAAINDAAVSQAAGGDAPGTQERADELLRVAYKLLKQLEHDPRFDALNPFHDFLED